MNVKEIKEIVNLMNDNKNGYQSKISFYKVSDECKKKIFNQCSIELIDNIIISLL